MTDSVQLDKGTANPIVDPDSPYEKAEFTIVDNIIVGKEKATRTETISELVLNSMNQYPDFVAQINAVTGRQITFAEMRDLSIRCAVWLQKQNIGPDDVVVSCLPLLDEEYIPVLSTYFVGAIYNPWYTGITEEIAEKFFTLTQPKIVITSEQVVDMLFNARKRTQVDCQILVVGKHPQFPSLLDVLSQQSADEVAAFQLVKPKDPKNQISAIVFTSGSEGDAKGVIYTYECLSNRQPEEYLRGSSYAIWYSSCAWGAGLYLMTTFITVRLTRILHPAFHPEETGKIIEKYKVDWAFLTPTMLTIMSSQNIFRKYDFSALKILFTTGANLIIKVAEDIRKAVPHVFLCVCYALTEACGVVTRQTKGCKLINSSGYVMDGTSLKVVDPKTGSLLGANKVGKICIKLNHRMTGYYKNPEATKKAIDSEGWLHSGDCGFYDDDGEIIILDRISRLIPIQNNYILPTQIEQTLMQHPAVANVAVVPVPSANDCDRPLAFVVLKPGASVAADELIQLSAGIDKYSVLVGIIFVDKFPLIHTGKVNYQQLKAMAKEHLGLK